MAGFDDIAEALSLEIQGAVLPDVLIGFYEEPQRHYHTAEHLFHCLTELQNCPPPHDPHVGLALWFHDAVYEPRRDDNEARCIKLVGLYAREMRLNRESLKIVQRLIRATDHRTPPAGRDEKLIVDIDLAILGKPPKVFDAYERAVRKEYAHVSEPEFRAGRARILQSFLDRKSIYHTPRFRRLYETPARDNLARSLGNLR